MHEHGRWSIVHSIETNNEELMGAAERLQDEGYGVIDYAIDAEDLAVWYPAWHVIPPEDVREHQLDGGNCWCEPEFKFTGDGNLPLWVHNSQSELTPHNQ